MRRIIGMIACMLCLISSGHADEASTPRRLLYVCVPGIRNQVEYGGVGILVFDIDHGHQFVRRIPVPMLTAAPASEAKPLAVKGVCADAASAKLFLTTPLGMACIDLLTDKQIWQKTYEAGCDRMAIAPDGKKMYVPTFEGNYWHVVDPSTGDEIAKALTQDPHPGAHNTVYGADGSECYCAGLRTPLLTVSDTTNQSIKKSIGPFAASIRPFTVNGSQTLCYVCINGLLGFEIGDLKTGQKLYRVEVQGFTQGAVKRHGCPSHGVGLTPNEKEVWVVDGHNQMVHVFDNTVMPPKQVASIAVHDQPGWVTFSIDGTYAYPSTGDVIDVASRKTLLELKDETGRLVSSEKLLEIDFVGNKPVRAGCQFGTGQVSVRASK